MVDPPLTGNSGSPMRPGRREHDLHPEWDESCGEARVP
jgi:hypothetical protein